MQLLKVVNQAEPDLDKIEQLLNQDLSLSLKLLRYVNHLKRFPQPIVTQLVQATTFYQAEEYHQDYYKKNPVRYNLYRSNCGRDLRVEQLWGKR